MSDDLAAARFAGVTVEALDAAALRDTEPRLSPHLAGGAFYPQDAQVQPMRAALGYLALARRYGARMVAGAEALALATRPGVARRLGSALPVRPRRGRILVTRGTPGAFPPVSAWREDRS